MLLVKKKEVLLVVMNIQKVKINIVILKIAINYSKDNEIIRI